MQDFKLDIFFNLSIIFPTLVGIFVFNKISKNYRYFIISIIAATLHEYNAEFQIVHYAIFDFFYSILSTQLILVMYFNWDTGRVAHPIKIFIHSIALVLVLIDQYYDYLSAYHIKWAYIACNIGISFYGFRLLNQVQNNLISTKTGLTRKLIIIPYMVFSIYYAAINIFMHFLYNAKTHLIFMDLYNVIRWINFLSYVSYTLALLWAPKKEKFL